MSKALVIEDSQQIADSLVNMLAFFDIEAQAAYGARAGLNALKTMIPTMVLLDLNMPDQTGLEVLGLMRSEPVLENVPLIVMTSDDQLELAEIAMQQGAAAFVIKPMRLDVLELTLKTLNQDL